MNKLYVIENLTLCRKHLFWLAKQKEPNYMFIWTSNGQIFIHEDEQADSLLIRTECNLDNLLWSNVCCNLFTVMFCDE